MMFSWYWKSALYHHISSSLSTGAGRVDPCFHLYTKHLNFAAEIMITSENIFSFCGPILVSLGTVASVSCSGVVGIAANRLLGGAASLCFGPWQRQQLTRW